MLIGLKNSLNELIKRSKNHARSGQILWMFLNVEMFKKLTLIKIGDGKKIKL